mmetsp:Transcript_29366/g.67585  ORF Transcript_29366/g.67585 Transcript_29366/m.67585 type:complete len:106 (-) Transcript_29366:160-477(-)
MQLSAQRQTAATLLAFLSCVTGLVIQASGEESHECVTGCTPVPPHRAMEAQDPWVKMVPSNYSCTSIDDNKVTVNRMILVGFIGLLGGGISAISSPVTAGLLLAL